MTQKAERKYTEALQETLHYLASAEALATLDADPYWPKWDSPWWRMLLLHEMGLTREIPAVAIEKLTSVLSTHCLQIFPFRIEDVPPGMDPVRQVPCHCQLGTVYQVLTAYGVDVDARLPWIRKWFLHYQLPDGGLNCDEVAYTKANPRSSIVSTLPPLEAMLLYTPRPFTPDEVRFLDHGAKYLLERRLWRSVSRGGVVMQESWAKPCFPRFYHYDLLRGLAFLIRYARRVGRPLPLDAMVEAFETIGTAADDKSNLAPQRQAFAGEKTLRRNENGKWQKGEIAKSFPLLDAVSAMGVVSPFLTREWGEVRMGVSEVCR